MAWLCPVSANAGLSLAPAAEAVTLRRESGVRFSADETFLRAGGVQYFYQLIEREAQPQAHKNFALFRHFDINERWGTLDSAPHVIISRVVHSLARPSSYFSYKRANDLSYIQSVAPQMQVTRQADGRFRVGTTPSNTFLVHHFSAQQLDELAPTLGVKHMLDLCSEQRLDALVIQENTDFAPVLGMRTAEMSVTWTGHVATDVNETRLCVVAMTYLHTLPPFFLGGVARMHNEYVSGTRALIGALRRH